MLNVIILSVVMLSVVATSKGLHLGRFQAYPQISDLGEEVSNKKCTILQSCNRNYSCKKYCSTGQFRMGLLNAHNAT